VFNGGNVGIGKTTANAKLDVSGSAIITGSLTVTQGITAASYNGYTPMPTAAATTTGVTITFLTDTVYGSLASPETGNITANVTGAQLGVTSIIIHNSGTAPTFSSEFKKLSGSGNYLVSNINYIFCTYISTTEIIYSINQRT
jgi:hypothetical protein